MTTITLEHIMPDLSPTRPLHSQIRDLLRQQILEGHYQQHDKLPSEKELMDHFGVSRITVRHALGALQQQGLVFKVTGKGCFVSSPAAKPVQELARLQGFAEAMNQRGYEACNQVLSITPMPASEAVAHAFQLRPGDEVVEIRRLRYLDRVPVSLDISYFDASLGHRLAREDLAGRDIFLILENDYGTPLGYADLAIHATQADHEQARWLDVETGSPLMYVERLTHGRDGQPLELDYIYYRGDRFSYQLRINRHQG